MAGVFFHDGTWTTEEPKLTGPMDHAFWLGSVIFDGGRAIKGVAPDLDRHCARCVASAKAMLMKPTKTPEEIEALCREGIRRMGPEATLYIRPMFFVRKGLGAARPDPDSTDFVLAIYDSPLPGFTGFSATMAPFRRPAPDMAPTDAKASCLYPNGARATSWAVERGFEMAVLCDEAGNVAEFAASNLMFVKDGKVITPAPNGTFLNGITRQRVIALLREAGVTVEERAVAPAELDEADEIFSTGNYAKVQPCTNYNGRALQPGPMARKARELYFDWAEKHWRILPKAG
ncbi:branched-chain amino acid aminotransferase [Falsiroseomonas bella]|uniref:Probable branched-chain-amino-acid aminotransferase n=1 Tax=Falsiroseomonas bella TaxID=2184016 RepID=A0A317FHF7_9PROT|nr:branched-chain amino acid aminotransferase [Falsiroseomonas bella]PWS38023.1 branched-chain amino acid aminotransferase [Falsiroseomonas bella]